MDPPPKPKFNNWTVSFDDHMAYLRSMDAIKRKQLADCLPEIERNTVVRSPVGEA